MKSHLDRIAEWARWGRKARYRSHQLALLCKVSPRQLERYFRAHFGQTPGQWLNRLQLRDAASTLEFPGGHVKEVAYDHGFIHPSHFIRKFKQIYDCTPLQYSIRARGERVVDTGNLQDDREPR